MSTPLNWLAVLKTEVRKTIKKQVEAVKQKCKAVTLTTTMITIYLFNEVFETNDYFMKKATKPTNKAPALKEHQIQTRFFQEIELMGWQKKKIFAFAIKNEVGKNNPVAGFRNKQAGVKAGVPDVMALEVPFNGKPPLFLEFKSKAGKQNNSQKEMEIYLTQQGYKYALVRSCEEAINVVKEYF